MTSSTNASHAQHTPRHRISPVRRCVRGVLHRLSASTHTKSSLLPRSNTRFRVLGVRQTLCPRSRVEVALANIQRTSLSDSTAYPSPRSPPQSLPVEDEPVSEPPLVETSKERTAEVTPAPVPASSPAATPQTTCPITIPTHGGFELLPKPLPISSCHLPSPLTSAVITTPTSFTFYPEIPTMVHHFHQQSIVTQTRLRQRRASRSRSSDARTSLGKTVVASKLGQKVMTWEDLEDPPTFQARPHINTRPYQPSNTNSRSSSSSLSSSFSFSSSSTTQATPSAPAQPHRLCTEPLYLDLATFFLKITQLHSWSNTGLHYTRITARIVSLAPCFKTLPFHAPGELWSQLTKGLSALKLELELCAAQSEKDRIEVEMRMNASMQQRQHHQSLFRVNSYAEAVARREWKAQCDIELRVDRILAVIEKLEFWRD